MDTVEPVFSRPNDQRPPAMFSNVLITFQRKCPLEEQPPAGRGYIFYFTAAKADSSLYFEKTDCSIF